MAAVLTTSNALPASLPASLPKAIDTTSSSRRLHTRRPMSRSHTCAVIQTAARRRRRTTRVVVADSAAPTPASVRVRLPATLARPTFKDIDADALASIDPTLAAIPLEYVLDKLRVAGPSMLSVASSAKPVSELGTLEQHIDVTVDNAHPQKPTHMLAVWSKNEQSGSLRKVELFSVHDIVLAASCAHMTPLQTTSPHETLSGDAATRLPVVPLCVPHRESFALLQHYIYTRQESRLLASLLPEAPKGMEPQNLAHYYAQSCSPAVLMQHAIRVHGLWSNVCALGVFDDSLWHVMDLSWALLLESLRLAGHSIHNL